MSPHRAAEGAIEYKRKESERKRNKVFAVVDAMVEKGEKVTFTAVQAAAGVSRWLVFQPEMASYIRAAIDRTEGAPDWLDHWDNDDDETTPPVILG